MNGWTLIIIIDQRERKTNDNWKIIYIKGIFESNDATKILIIVSVRVVRQLLKKINYIWLLIQTLVFFNHDYYYQSVITFAKNIGWCITESHHIFIICIKIAKIIIRMIMFLATYIWFRDEYLLFVLLLYRLTWGWQWSNKKLEIRNLWSVKLIFISQFNNTVMLLLVPCYQLYFLCLCVPIYSLVPDIMYERAMQMLL